MATNIVGATGIDKVQDGIIVNADIDTVAASKLTGALPAISGASLTNIPAANITGTLPAISGANLTAVNAVNGGRKNLIINGDFSVNQRGTAATTGGTYLTADRFKAGATNVTFQTVANDRDLSISNMLKVTSHTTGYGIIVQPIEDVHTASGKNITLSFWAKTANFSSFRLELQQNFGSGGSATVTVVNNASYFSVPDTGWNKYTATIAIPSISGKTVGTGSHLNMVLGPNSGTSGGITYYSEVQVELGSVATDFEYRSYGEELSLCQRYYYKWDASSSSYLNICMGKAVNSTKSRGVVDYPVTMRNTPTIDSSGSFRSVDTAANTGASVSISRASKFNTYIQFVGTSGSNLTTGAVTEMGADNDVNAWIAFDAEL